VIREAVISSSIRGDGEYDRFAEDQPLVVQDLVAGGLQFSVTKAFLDSIQMRNPFSSSSMSNPWVLESMLLLLENDPNCAISAEFMKPIILDGRPTKAHLQRLFWTCNKVGIAQDVFEQLPGYCHRVETIELVMETIKELKIDFFTTETFTASLIKHVYCEQIVKAVWRFGDFDQYSRLWDQLLGYEGLESAFPQADLDILLRPITSRIIPSMTSLGNLITQNTFEQAIKRCNDFKIVNGLKQMNWNLVITKDVLIAASKNRSVKDNFLARLLLIRSG
jgi:phosphopantetheine adenylyltransferase